MARSSRRTPRPGAPTVERETTLRDALSALLGSSVQLGVVVDERGRVIGVISVDAISETMRVPEGPPDENAAGSPAVADAT